LLGAARRHAVVYPVDSFAAWDIVAISAANAALLDAVAGAANLYAIFAAPPNSVAFAPRYIGKTSRGLARQRLRNHLIKKDDRTGAHLAAVQAPVQVQHAPALTFPAVGVYLMLAGVQAGDASQVDHCRMVTPG